MDFSRNMPVCGMVMILSFAVVPVGAYSQKVTNKSRNRIEVRLEYHGKAGGNIIPCWSCCDDNFTLDAGKDKTVPSYGCQLRHITIRENNKDVASISVRNASLNVAKQVGGAALAVMGGASAASSNSAAGVYMGASTASTGTSLMMSSDSFEFVAYGSTGWEYLGGGQLKPVSGVKVYGK